MEHIEVSSEMTTLLGVGTCGEAPWPPAPVGLQFDLGDGGGAPTLRLDPDPTVRSIDMADTGAFRLVLLVCRPAVLRLGGGEVLLEPRHTDFHLPGPLRAIGASLRDPPTMPETRSTYRLAKSIELFCETLQLLAERGLAPLSPGAGERPGLSSSDAHRVMAARRLIDDRGCEKLTLDIIARTCGLNRAKLTRGFREMFDCSIAQALAERRLSQASRLLLTTDLLVSSVGYESGYLNNASFSRAFSRHFGRSPSDYRALGVAA